MDDQEAKWKEVWNLYDLDKDGKVTRAEFMAAVRVCGRRYTADQMADKTKNFGEQISYDTFFGFMCDPYTGPSEEDLRNALRAFDGKDCGELTVSQIQSMLTTMGTKIPLEDVKPLLESMPQNAGKVQIDQLVTFLTPGIPSANPNVPELMKELMREETAKVGMPMYEMPKEAPPKPAADADAAPAAADAPAEGDAAGDGAAAAVVIPDAPMLESGSDSDM